MYFTSSEESLRSICYCTVKFIFHYPWNHLQWIIGILFLIQMALGNSVDENVLVVDSLHMAETYQYHFAPNADRSGTYLKCSNGHVYFALGMDRLLLVFEVSATVCVCYCCFFIALNCIRVVSIFSSNCVMSLGSVDLCLIRKTCANIFSLNVLCCFEFFLLLMLNCFRNVTGLLAVVPLSWVNCIVCAADLHNYFGEFLKLLMVVFCRIF